VVAGCIALAIASWWTSRENLRAGSKVVGGPPVRVTHVPTSYQAVFRVENRAGKALVVNTEKVWMRRPFQSRIEDWRGPPPGTTRLTLRQSAFGVLASTSEASSPLNIAAPPSVASGDVRIDAVLDEIIRGHYGLRREQREVYGRRCQVYRLGGPVLAGDVTRYEPGKGDFTDVCIDANGIVLEEYWVQDGRLLRRRVATELKIDPPIDDKVFAIDVPINPDIHRGLVRRMTGNPKPSRVGFWTLPHLPHGFETIGRFVVVLSDQALPQVSALEPALTGTSTSDVFVRGPDLLVVDQDPSLAQLVGHEGRPSRKVNLGRIKDGELIVDGRMSEVHGRTPDGSFVRLVGTLAPDDLVRLARGLRPLQG
jgi:hypothetical protein